MVWLLVLLAIYLLILGVAVRLSLFPARTPVFISPGSMGFPQEDFETETRDGIRIRGWVVPHSQPKGVAVLIHGYLMNRSELTPLACWLHQRGWASVIVDLRAHGKSSGRKSTLGIQERLDVAAAARYARQRFAGIPVLLVGSSMGSAAATFALSEDPTLADGLVVDSGYSRLPDAVLGWWYFLGGAPLRFVLAPSVLLAAPFVGFNPFKVDVANALPKVTSPVLFVHGECDTLAAPSQVLRNHAAYAGDTEIIWFPGCGHSEGRWIHPDRYYEAMERFLAMIEKTPPQTATAAAS